MSRTCLEPRSTQCSRNGSRLAATDHVTFSSDEYHICDDNHRFHMHQNFLILKPRLIIRAYFKLNLSKFPPFSKTFPQSTCRFWEKVACKTDVSNRIMEGNLLVLPKDTIAEGKTVSNI